jgi:hypothetical protein
METNELKIDFEKLKEQKKKNFQERIWFIKYWAKYIRENPDEKWSEGHTILINSQFQDAKIFLNNDKNIKKIKRILKNP